MRSRLITLLQWVIGIAVVGFAAWQVGTNWNTVRAAQVALVFRPVPLLSALLLVWTGFGALIVAWRITVQAAGRPLSLRNAAHVWTVSSLGKYLPGKVWALAGMMVLARQNGISGTVAAAAAVFQQVLSLCTGALLVFLCGREQLIDLLPGGRIAFGILLGSVIVLLGVPMSPSLMRRVMQAVQARTRSAGAEQSPDEPPALADGLPLPVLLQSTAANVLAWMAYGGALVLLARGLLPDLVQGLSYGEALGGFTAAYIAGVLAFLAPGGLGVREGLIVLLLAPQMGQGSAAVLALATRVLFTVAEFGAAAPFVLVAKEKSRVGS